MASVGPGVREVRVCEEGGTFRVLYVTRIEEAIYVLHAFQKKTRAARRRATGTWRPRGCGRSSGGGEHGGARDLRERLGRDRGHARGRGAHAAALGADDGGRARGARLGADPGRGGPTPWRDAAAPQRPAAGQDHRVQPRRAGGTRRPGRLRRAPRARSRRLYRAAPFRRAPNPATAASHNLGTTRVERANRSTPSFCWRTLQNTVPARVPGAPDHPSIAIRKASVSCVPRTGLDSMA